jgi:hypothetical protein
MVVKTLLKASKIAKSKSPGEFAMRTIDTISSGVKVIKKKVKKEKDKKKKINKVSEQ